MSRRKAYLEYTRSLLTITELDREHYEANGNYAMAEILRLEAEDLRNELEG